MSQNSTLSNSSIFLFGGLVVLVTIGLFAAIVLWPSGEKTQPSEFVLGENALAQTLNDEPTIQFLEVLHRVKPNAARKLNTQAEAAIETGADKDDLAALVLASYGSDFEDDYQHLMRADVKYLDGMMRMVQRGLTTVSSGAPQYCKPAHYMKFEHMAPEEITHELASLFAHDSLGYRWGMQFNSLLLEAIESGRTSPKKYGRLNEADNQELQKVLLRLMQSHQFAQLAMLQTRSAEEQKSAAMTMNMCEMGKEVIGAFNTLPTETKARLLGGLQHQAKSGQIERILREAQSQF